jgi:fluoride ion exporter CrcB/FEX
MHYFGLALRIGAIMAAFLRWFLTKSINEPKGFSGLGLSISSGCGDFILSKLNQRAKLKL